MQMRLIAEDAGYVEASVRNVWINLTLGALGVFILWFGWFGFNPGSQLAASGTENSLAISHIFITTNLAAAAGGVTAMFVTWMKYKRPGLSLTLNGVLAGLVAIYFANTE